MTPIALVSNKLFKEVRITSSLESLLSVEVWRRVWPLIPIYTTMSFIFEPAVIITRQAAYLYVTESNENRHSGSRDKLGTLHIT